MPLSKSARREARHSCAFLLLLATAFFAPATQAEVTKFQVNTRADLPAQLTELGIPPYEKWTGEVTFAVDPNNPANGAITDIQHAPRNGEGRVEAKANFVLLRPKNLAADRRIALVEVSNRGSKAALVMFNNAVRAADPIVPEHYGDGLLMRHGLTLVWIGWQFDVPAAQENAMRLEVPIATDGAQRIYGWVRSDWVVDQTTDRLELGHRGHRAYAPALDRSDHQLTYRTGVDETRLQVPRSSWSFEQTGDGKWWLRGRFETGRIYELVYTARDPSLAGLGLVAIRDIASFLKYDTSAPLRVDKAIAFGVSQTGRFLRHFLYQGMNADEAGRKVYDGMLIHTAGAGRGSFNHRFAQPSHDAHRYSSFLYPTDLFPFSGRTQVDSRSGESGGLLERAYAANVAPTIFYTNTGYEYWGRGAALIHTTPEGDADVEPLPNERIYHLPSAQHFVDVWPITAERQVAGRPLYVGNPADSALPMRAILVALVEWLADGIEPPNSRYPHLADGTLVPFDRWLGPPIPGLETPVSPYRPRRLEFGPNWHRGITGYEPPHIGEYYPALVPALDELGNERGGVPMLELMVPVATFTPWSLRDGLTNPREMADFRGYIAPLPRDEREQQRNSDPRLALTQVYASEREYRDKVEAALTRLVAERFLLFEDQERARARALELWRWVNRR